MKKIISLSYKPIRGDTRVLNQISALKENYNVYTIELKNWKKYKLFKKRKIKINSIFEHSIFYPIKLFFILIKKIFSVVKKIINFINILLKINTVISVFKNFILINYVLINKVIKLNIVPDVIYANDLLTLPTGVLFKFKFGSKLIYDMHEYELDRPPRNNIFKKITIYLLEELLLPFTDCITTVSYSIKIYYKKRFKKKIFLVLNSPDIKFLENINFESYTSKIKNDFVYIGNISFGRNIEDLINVAQKNNFNLTFVGSINKEFESQTNFLKKINISHNLNYMDPVSPDKIFNILLDYKASIFLYDTSFKNYDFALPNKFLLSLIMKKPIICFETTELKRFQKRHKVKLNFIKTLTDLEKTKLEVPNLSSDQIKFYSKERQSKTIKKIVINVLKRSNY